MSVANPPQNGSLQQWVVGRQEPSGQFTAHVVGVPELRATAATRDEAIAQIRAMIADWLAAGKLMAVEVPCPNPLMHFSGHLDPNDPLEQEFVKELSRQRQQDLDETLREDRQGCSNSSSTPTT
jgi:predicted RNase H-like HicB family nuclease